MPRGDNQINAHNQIEGLMGKPDNESQPPEANSNIPSSTSGIRRRGFANIKAGGSGDRAPLVLPARRSCRNAMELL
jgi:hypothetical protein